MSRDTDGAIGIRLNFEAMLGKINDTLGGVTSALDRVHKFMSANPRQSPIVRPLLGSIVSDGSTYVFIDLGGPSAGRLWDVRRVSVAKTGTADLSTAVANVIVNLVVRQGSGSFNQVGAANVTGMADLIDVASAANNPYRNTWSAHEATLRFGQRLIVALKATSNNDNWSAWGQAEEYVESSLEIVTA